MPAKGPSLPSRYAVAEPIAQGGMGDVYRVTDGRLGRTVAVKVLAGRYATNAEFQARFLREARTAASLSGEPFVVAIYDVGENEDGLPYIVMEYAPGGTVADRLRAGPIETGQATRWLEQAAEALDAAHARRIVHRDVKPANLLLAQDGTIRVSDFGIARAAGSDTLTAAGTVLGSAGYMAPEQARGEPSTAATDRYALACVAFELLTGSRPFARDGVAAEAAAHANEPPPSVGAFDPRLPRALDGVFAHGLAKLPAHRPASCAALVADLKDAIADRDATTMAAVGSAAPTVAASPPVVRHVSRRRRGATLPAAAALLGAGGLLAWALTAVGGESPGATVVLTETLHGETIVRTVTTEGDTVVRTETVQADEPSEPPPSRPSPSESGSALNDQGFRLLQQGDATGALPALESAVSALSGSGSVTEAYASYNLAVARFALGRCDGVAGLLDRSEEVQGERKEIDRLRKQVERRCEAD